jgi:chromosome partitioning protein
LVEGLSKAFPQRIIAPPIPFVNSISDLLATSLASPSTSVRQAARRAFETMSDNYDDRIPAENLDGPEALSA